MPIDLSWSDLAGRDLTGADLRYANFEHCNLRHTILGPGTTAWNANFSSADMYQANLRGAELPNADFTNADLYEATLREANLRCAKLAQCRGALRHHQLAGADITGAILPPQLDKLLSSLDNVKSISESARKLFLAVLAACLYCWLTIASTTDLNLITNRISSPLPIIQTAIPIVGFYVVAPILLLCTYLYFHFYLQKLWEELGSLPAFLQDGCPLHAKVDPWLLNDLVRAHLTLLKPNRPFLSHLQLRISVLLAWWVVPITLFLFWARYIRRHDPIITALHVILLSLALLAAFLLYRLAIATLRGMERVPFRWKQLLTSRRGYKGVAATTAILALLTLASLGAIKGDEPQGPLFARDPQTKKFHFGADARNRHTWVPRFASLFGYSVFADLSNQEVSTKKATWTRQNAKQPDSVAGAKLSKANLRFADLKGAFLSFADLNEADLTGAHLFGADLTGADLSEANLTGANLNEANLTGALLTKTHLNGALLSEALLNGALLLWANLSEADLTEADLTGAGLTEAHLTRADLTQADLTEADLSGADLSGAHLGGAHLSRANLIEANLTRADLTGADLSGANLSGADLTGAYLIEVNLKYVKLVNVRNLDSGQLLSTPNYNQAFYDDDMIKTLGLPPDHNEKLKQQQTEDQEDAKKSAPKPTPSPTP